MSASLEPNQEFERSLMLGFARSGKPGEQPLAKLSLLAAQRKFARVAVPNPAASSFQRTETMRFIPDQARKHLTRLVSGKDGNITDAMSRRAVTALRKSGCSLHPFDFARLEDFITKYAEALGPDARQWLSMVRPDTKVENDTYFDAEITEQNLAQVSRGQRLQFLREMRAHNPSRARELIEGLISGEPADVRLKYLGVMSLNLGTEDKSFIEALLSDRAPSVKEMANTLLARLPGSEGHGRRMLLLRDYFEVKTEGLLRRRKVLHCKGPGGKKQDEKQKFITQALQDASLTDFAAALGLDEATLAEAALQTENERVLTAIVLQMVVNAGRTDILANQKGKFAGQGFDLLPLVVTEQFRDLPTRQQDEILTIIIQPSSWSFLPMPHVVDGLANTVDRVLPEAIAHDLLQCAAWQKTEENLRQHHVNAWACLVPASLSQRFADLAEPYSPRATTYHRFLHTLMQPI